MNRVSFVLVNYLCCWIICEGLVALAGGPDSIAVVQPSHSCPLPLVKGIGVLEAIKQTKRNLRKPKQTEGKKLFAGLCVV